LLKPPPQGEPGTHSTSILIAPVPNVPDFDCPLIVRVTPQPEKLQFGG